MSIKNSYKYLYTCSDLSLASTLSIWFPILKINTTNPRKADFYFSDTKELQEKIEKYWKNEILVEPKLMFQSIKLLKSRIYQG